jgi:hypothetical protein
MIAFGEGLGLRCGLAATRCAAEPNAVAYGCGGAREKGPAMPAAPVFYPPKIEQMLPGEDKTVRELCETFDII